MGNEKLSEELLNTHPSEVLGKVHAWSGKIAALEARAEKAERERDAERAYMVRVFDGVFDAIGDDEREGDVVESVREAVSELNVEIEDKLRHIAQARTERDAALTSVRELEVDAEELAAFRWLMGWLRSPESVSETRTIKICFARWYRGDLMAIRDRRDGCMAFYGPTPVALATALDPEWRTHA